MNDIEAREISLSIPAMIWQRWEGLVKVALDRSEGVLDFTLKLARARVKFDSVKISEETIIKNIKKLTRYDQVEITEDPMEGTIAWEMRFKAVKAFKKKQVPI